MCPHKQKGKHRDSCLWIILPDAVLSSCSVLAIVSHLCSSQTHLEFWAFNHTPLLTFFFLLLSSFSLFPLGGVCVRETGSSDGTGLAWNSQFSCFLTESHLSWSPCCSKWLLLVLGLISILSLWEETRGDLEALASQDFRKT